MVYIFSNFTNYVFHPSSPLIGLTPGLNEVRPISSAASTLPAHYAISYNVYRPTADRSSDVMDVHFATSCQEC